MSAALVTGWRRPVSSQAAAAAAPDIHRPILRWSAARAHQWYRRQPWLVGCNYVPSTAVNQLEMWQEETFDAPTIERELALAASLGFTVVRVFLHDLLWDHEREAMAGRLDRFLEICERNHLRAIVVFFDGVWNNFAHRGPQPAPIPGVHNSGWLQSPHPKEVVDNLAWPRLENYVSDVITRFRQDERVLMWDLYNEPGNEGLLENALPLLAATFRWARRVDPIQPLTAGLWSWTHRFDRLNQFQVEASDVITFHEYSDSATTEALTRRLLEHGRPVVCTEFMARTLGSRIETHLPWFRSHEVGAVMWGLVSGRTQTIYPWKSPYGASPPEVWFHDLFRPDGTPFDPLEVALIRRLTGIEGMEEGREALLLG